MNEPLENPESNPLPGASGPAHRPKRLKLGGLNLRVEALEGLAIQLPSRVNALMQSAEPPVLMPGPCQSDHPLSPALDALGNEALQGQVTADPSFPTEAPSDEELPSVQGR